MTLRGGGTGSASARPSRAAGARSPPSASRQPPTSRSRLAPGERSLGLSPARATSSPEHRESGEASRHPKPCPASRGTESRWPSQPHRLPAAGPEVAGRGLRRARSGHFKKKKIQSYKELYWQLHAWTVAYTGQLGGRRSLVKSTTWGWAMCQDLC